MIEYAKMDIKKYNYYLDALENFGQLRVSKVAFDLLRNEPKIDDTEKEIYDIFEKLNLIKKDYDTDIEVDPLSGEVADAHLLFKGIEHIYEKNLIEFISIFNKELEEKLKRSPLILTCSCPRKHFIFEFKNPADIIKALQVRLYSKNCKQEITQNDLHSFLKYNMLLIS
jgi:hypothetical protein